MTYRPHTLIPDDFTIDPSRSLDPKVSVVEAASSDTDAVGVAVATSGEVAADLGFDREALTALGFTGKMGQTLLLPRPDGTVRVAVGVGEPGSLTAAALRDAAAAFTRSVASKGALAIDLLGAATEVERDAAIAAIAEGALLARYRYDALKTSPKTVQLTRLEIIGDAAGSGTAAVERGVTLARAAMLTRDLAAAPPAHLTATRLAEYALATAPQFGIEATAFDKQQLIELGCGGILGVNSGSVEEPRMIQLRYRPEAASAHLAFVGKGITYDSGGLSLKPGDAMHASMKMDMAGAAALLSVMFSLRALGCTNDVTAYLMCTDNLPSGSAMALGDVLHIYGGTTIEVRNTDAEGRLVMADAIALAAEQNVDAIVDIATLTGAALRALGTLTAPVFGNDQGVVDQVLAASALTDETMWQLPLDRRYRDLLNSDIADLSNVGGPNAGATTAALFLAEFAGDTPWAHLDIAGTMMADRDDLWRSKGPTGFGARLLAEFAVAFTPTRPSAR